MAREIGLGKTYIALYGFLSMGAHGNTFAIDSAFEPEEALFVSAQAAASLLEVITTLVANWIVGQRTTDMAAIHTTLRLRKFEMHPGGQ